MPTVIPDGPPVCWKCMKREVRRALDMCDECLTIPSDKETPTHERTHEKRRSDLWDSHLDEAGYRRWEDNRVIDD